MVSPPQDVLLVVAHPDDEVLGCGGSAAAVAADGASVRMCVVSGGVEARSGRPEAHELLDDMLRAQKKLGLGDPVIGRFPNMELNTVPHLELVRFIEGAIIETQARTIFTHHPADLNDDHRQVSLACQAAARLFQRRSNVGALSALYYMEILSSTEWAFPSSGSSFLPVAYFEINEQYLQQKLEALSEYRGVMRDYPHPRSPEVIRGLAALRGSQAGMHYAEAFEVAFLEIQRFHHNGLREIR